MADVYRTLDDKPYESGYLYLETILYHPLERVWPYVLDIGSWMTAHRLETLSGQAGQAGHFERVHPRDLVADVGSPRYHLYGVAEIIPFKCIALEVFPEKGGSYGDPSAWVSFDSLLFTDLGGRTQLVFLMIDMHPGKAGAAFREHQKRKLEGGRELISEYFEYLKRLIDERHEPQAR